MAWPSVFFADRAGGNKILKEGESRIVRIRLCGEYPVPILKMKQKRHWKTGRDGYGLKTLLTAGLRKEHPDHGLNAEKRKQTMR